MPDQIRHRPRWPLTTRRLLLPALLLAAGLSAAACGGGVSDDDFNDLQAQVAALQEQVSEAQEASQRALLFAILPAFDAALFHEIDESINNDGVIQQTAPGVVQRALDAVQNTDWPATLTANVAQWESALIDLLHPVLEDDAQAAGRPATVVHALSHAFEQAVSAFLNDDPIPAPPELGDGDEHGADAHEAADDEDGDHAHADEGADPHADADVDASHEDGDEDSEE